MTKDTDKNTHGRNHSLYTIPKVTTTNNYKLFVDTFFDTSTEIHKIWNTLLSATENDTLELRIQSPGGLVTECQMLVNIMKNKFNGRVTAYIDSHASSAGAFTFCAADKRVVFENSRIMLHNYSGGHQGTHHKMKTRLDFDTVHIIDFLKSTLKIGKKGYLTNKELDRMIEGHEWWFTAKEMCKRGIATHVIVNGKEITAKQYLKSLKTSKK